jgi:hypothetical protein
MAGHAELAAGLEDLAFADGELFVTGGGAVEGGLQLLFRCSRLKRAG